MTELRHRRRIPNSLANVRLESRAGKDLPAITGYAAVYYRADDPGTEYHIFDDLVERIMPGAFDAPVAQQDDIRSFFNHNPNAMLGRRSSGTASFSADDVGLLMRIEPPNTQPARDVIQLLERGDVDGASFMFLVGSSAKRSKVVWSEEKDEETGRLVDVRELHAFEVFEAGPVVFPAYEATTSGVDSRDASQLDLARQEWRAARQRGKITGPTAEQLEARLAQVFADTQQA
tara:strand:+ start:4159 stop:4854 length:696 start_codon:yes stop_codon:yes gene_type:complete